MGSQAAPGPTVPSVQVTLPRAWPHSPAGEERAGGSEDMGTAEGGSEAEKRNPGRHWSYSTSQSGQAMCVRLELETGNASLTSQTTHTHVHMHKCICAHTCTIHTYAHAHACPCGHRHTFTHWCVHTLKQTQHLSPQNVSHPNSTFAGGTIRSLFPPLDSARLQETWSAFPTSGPGPST